MSSPPKRSKIYAITGKNTNKIYIGACKNYLSARKAQHKYYFKKFQQSIENGTSPKQFYSSSLVYLDDPNATIKELELVEDELYTGQRETYYMNYFREKGLEVVNIKDGCENIEKRKKRQLGYYKQEPDKFRDRCREYYYDNREKILERYKEKRLKEKKEIARQKNIEEIAKGICSFD